LDSFRICVPALAGSDFGFRVFFLAVLLPALVQGVTAPSDPNSPPSDPNSPSSGRGELTGFVVAEGRLFFHDPLFDDQEEHNGSLAAQPEYYYQWANGALFTFTPFGRVDSADSERTHADIRELYYFYPRDWWAFRVGIARVFWGATEFVHLVDVINQVDLVEHPDGEDKLGQAMIQFTMNRQWGALDIFILPWFRERTFPGREGRLRPGLEIDTEDAFFEGRRKSRTPDLAFRYSRTLGDIDFGVFFFRGTNRDPMLIPPGLVYPDDTDTTRLIPFYEQVRQFGADAQWAMGNWLWKFEALYRNGYLDPYFAGTGGVEYTWVGFGGGQTDLGLLAEYAYDERGDDLGTTSPYDNDVFLGLRVTPNDMASTQLLMGVMQDVADDENIVVVEASRRFGSHWRLSLDAWVFCSIPEDSPIYDLRDDDFVRLELAYYF